MYILFFFHANVIAVVDVDVDVVVNVDVDVAVDDVAAVEAALILCY